MLSRVAIELLAAALIAGAICLAGAAAGLWWLKRRVRRGLEAAGRAITTRAITTRTAGGWAAGSGAATAGRRWLWSRQLPDRRWIAARQARQELWRAVSAADHAVKTARQSGAPTGTWTPCAAGFTALPPTPTAPCRWPGGPRQPAAAWERSRPRSAS